jgi:type II secretory pathway pseudopilin PulG
MTRVQRFRGQHGESLAELLVAIAIMGIAIVVIVGGLGNAIFASNVHRNYATAGAVARNAAEKLKDRKFPWNANGNYTVSGSNGFSVSVAAKCWDPNSTAAIPGNFHDCQNGDVGLQQLTVTASGKGTTETVTVLKRRT